MSHLATAVYAAETGQHLLEQPRDRRNDRSRQTFDEET
jgi:hypothetical protein